MTPCNILYSDAWGRLARVPGVSTWEDRQSSVLAGCHKRRVLFEVHRLFCSAANGTRLSFGWNCPVGLFRFECESRVDESVSHLCMHAWWTSHVSHVFSHIAVLLSCCRRNSAWLLNDFKPLSPALFLYSYESYGQNRFLFNDMFLHNG